MNKKLQELFDHRERGYVIFNYWLQNNNEYIISPDSFHHEVTAWVNSVAGTLKTFFRGRYWWNNSKYMFWTVTNTYEIIEEVDMYASVGMCDVYGTDSGKYFRYTGMSGTSVTLERDTNRIYWLSYLNHQLKLLDETIHDVIELLKGKPAQPARKPWKT